MGTRIVPHSNTVAEDLQDALKAPWTNEASVGRGFDRLTCQYKQSAISATPKPLKDAVLSKRTTDHLSITESSYEYSRNFSTATSASFSGWGASVSASAAYATNAKHSHKSVTTLINFEFLSEPHNALEPTQPGSDAKLHAEARELLAEEGPVKFHEVYGSHYVKGYTVGARQRAI